MAGAAAGNPHGIEEVAIFLRNPGADAAATASEPEARMRQTQVVAEFVPRHARAEVAVGEPQTRAADKSKRAKDRGRPRAGANDVEIKTSRRIARVCGGLPSGANQ